MPLHAVDDLTDAFEATRSFLLPFEFGRWVRLALLSLFVAGSGGGGGMTPQSPMQYTFEGTGTPGTPSLGGLGAELTRFLEANLWPLVGIALVLVLIGLVVAWLASIFEFSYLESLRADAVHVRDYYTQFRGLGTRLFAFRVIFGLFSAVVVGGIALLAIGPALLGFGTKPLLVLVVLFPLLFLVGLLAGIVYVFTTAFVVPIMLLEDRGVISGWRRLWGVMRGNWGQFAVFVLVGLFVMIGVGILVGIVTAILAAVVAIPFALIFLLALMLGIPALNIAVLAILGIPFALVMLAVVGFVQVPVQTYLRYWALLVLGDVESELDLIPEQRQTVRE